MIRGLHRGLELSCQTGTRALNAETSCIWVEPLPAGNTSITVTGCLPLKNSPPLEGRFIARVGDAAYLGNKTTTTPPCGHPSTGGE